MRCILYTHGGMQRELRPWAVLTHVQEVTILGALTKRGTVFLFKDGMTGRKYVHQIQYPASC